MRKVRRNFVKRGLKRHTHVRADGEPLWLAYRQLDNGEKIAIDKIEVATQIYSTATEIERIPRVAQLLPRFFKGKQEGRKRYVLLADELSHPFTDQTKEEFDTMLRDLEETIDKIKTAGGTVLRKINEAEALADEIDELLPPLTTKAVEEPV